MPQPGPTPDADRDADPRTGPVEVSPIGYVRSAYRRLADTPIQTSRNPQEAGRVVVGGRYAAGLEGLEGFDDVHLVSFLDQAWLADDRGGRPFDRDRLRPVPFLLQATGERVGVFATRAPVRPNYLGLHLVRVLAVHADGFDFAGVDLLDGTPVLDVKPFTPQFDVPGYRSGGSSAWLDQVRCGWYQRGDTAGNPLVRPGEAGLRGVGLTESREPADAPGMDD